MPAFAGMTAAIVEADCLSGNSRPVGQNPVKPHTKIFRFIQISVDATLHGVEPRFSSYGFSVSRNRTGSPCDGVTTSPCHITRLPRTNVPTGQPVTRRPS